MARIVEGLWDCKHCGATAIGGTTKHCPCCGHPQDDDTQFYLGEEKTYLEEEIAKDYGKGADWVCPYCDALNRTHYKFCSNCGAARENAEKDYFTPDANNTPQPQPQQAKPQPARKRSKLLPLLLLILVGVLIFNMIPKTGDFTVTAKSWERQIALETLQTFTEEGWEIPDGGRQLSTARAIHHYEQVFDHYEERTRQVPEQVYDGEDTHVEYVNNGDGTFTEKTYTTPRYRTEYRTETYQEKIYRDEPVYRTKYTYEIDRWVHSRTVKAQGGDTPPAWPEVTLEDKERQHSTLETYTLVLQDNKKSSIIAAEVSQAMWEKYAVGSTVSVTTRGGAVEKLDDQPVR